MGQQSTGYPNTDMIRPCFDALGVTWLLDEPRHRARLAQLSHCVSGFGNEALGAPQGVWTRQPLSPANSDRERFL